jgi:hypothetical protein
MIQSVAVQWLLRRIPEVFGLVSGLAAFVSAAPPEVQAVAMAVLTGQGGGLSIMAYIGVISWVYAQITSYRATVRPQAVVEDHGRLVSNPLSPAKATEVKQAVEHVSSGRTLWDIMRGK